MSDRLEPLRRVLRSIAVFLGLAAGEPGQAPADSRSRLRKQAELTALAAVISIVVGARLTVAHGVVCFVLLVAAFTARNLLRLEEPRANERRSFVVNTVGVALTTLPAMTFLHAAFDREEPFSASVGFGFVVGLAFAAGTAHEAQKDRRREAGLAESR